MDTSLKADPGKFALIISGSLITMALIAGYAYGYVFQNFYVAGDSITTIKNLTESPQLLTIFIFCFLLIFLLDVIVAWATYFFFREIDEPIAMLSSWLRLMYTAILGVSLTSLTFASQLQTVPGLGELMYKSLGNFLDVWALGLFVIGFHLILLGHLMIKSKFIPKVLGILAIFAGICYVVSNACHLLLPNYMAYKETVDLALTLPMALGELGLAFWLLKWSITDRSRPVST